MEKVIILSYFFPPANFAGSYRMKAWAENLHKFGYYPVVITRHWKENETDYTAISEEREIKKEEHDNYTVYRLPYKGSLRDRLVKRFGPKAKLLGKIFSFFQVVGQNYFLFSIPYRNLYYFTRSFLKEHSDINILLTSGRPFIHFRFACMLKKEFPHLHWVADYRDPWNSCSHIEESLKQRFFSFLETPKEKDWLRNAALITTTSEGFKEGINILLPEKKIEVITNGFDDFVTCNNAANNPFTIGYIGSLYPQQKIEVFLNGVISFLAKNSSFSLQIVFWGIGNETNQVRRVQSICKDYPELLKFEAWLPKSELIRRACKSHALLLCGIPQRKGTYTAKVFDYFALKKPIILCPSDNGELRTLIADTSTGFTCNTQDEVTQLLEYLLLDFQRNGKLNFQPNMDRIKDFTYRSQVEKLAKQLDHLTNPT